jgi:hypothetical protein
MRAPRKHPEPLQPPRSVSAAWDKLLPVQRVQKLREWQAQHPPTPPTGERRG